MGVHKKMHTTLRCKCKCNKLSCTELRIFLFEDESCNNVMGDESVNDYPLTDDMYQILVIKELK